MLKIKAKFKCQSITDNGFNKTAELFAVTSGAGENADFAKATPGGNLKITIDSETKADGFFVPQKEYYLTFEAVEN